MISILRPSTPPLALISSAAICAAWGIDAPAIAWASAMTPILIGSAAMAWADIANRPRAVAPRSPGNDRKNGGRNAFFMTFLYTELVIVALPASSASETPEDLFA